MLRRSPLLFLLPENTELSANDPESGNATPCNSFNAITGGDVTGSNAQTPHRVSVVAVQPPKNCEKISERQ
jgi:hypothetical protein